MVGAVFRSSASGITLEDGKVYQESHHDDRQGDDDCNWINFFFILSSLAINMKNNLNILSASWTTADLLEMILDHLVL